MKDPIKFIRLKIISALNGNITSGGSNVSIYNQVPSNATFPFIRVYGVSTTAVDNNQTKYNVECITRIEVVTRFDGDRGGSRYYLVMTPPGSSAGDGAVFRSGRYSPGFSDEVTAVVGNVFLKYKGAELFGFYETAMGKKSSEVDTRSVNQLGADLIYRLGKNENVYLGARYNILNAEDISGEDITINRYQVGGGWFLTPNVLAKLEYVNQDYKDFPTGDLLYGGNFNGIMIEAIVGF